MKEKLKNNKGITLVALIITIVVMLVLVGVAIATVINSNIIDKANEAGEQFGEAQNQEGSIGELTVGEAKYASIEDYIADRDVDIPDGYQEVEWIESNGTQYIDTNYIPNGNTKVELNIIEYGYTDGVWFGSYPTNGSWTTNSFGLYQNNRCYEQYWIHYCSNTPTNFDTVITSAKIALDKTGFYVNDELKLSVSYIDFSGVQTLYLLNGHGNGTNAQPMKAKIGNFTIWDNNIIVRNLIPCYRKSDGTIGMYDLCGSICPLTNSPFYINFGTGIFTKGADKII